MQKLITLPYAPDALAPAVSAQTLSFHHGKHLATYVNNLNKAVEGTPMDGLSLEELIVKSAAEGLTAVFNNAGQTLNHNMYFLQFSPKPKIAPDGPLKEAVDAAFGSLEEFKAAFNAAGASIFGSGWVWLQADGNGKLSIGKYPGADNPVAHGLRPLLTFDVWEHAYYLDWQNRRVDYVKAAVGLLDWNAASRRFA